MKTNIVVDILPAILYLENTGSRVMDQNVVGQSNCRIL